MARGTGQGLRRLRRLRRGVRPWRDALRTPSGGGPALDPEYYGEALVPRQFFEREWGAGFEVLEFIADRTRFEQAVCIMRRC